MTRRQTITNTIIKHFDHDYNTQIKNIYRLAELYPMLSVGSIGKSVCGRTLPLLTLGSGAEEVLFAAAFHGNERITATVLLAELELLCKCLRDREPFAGHNPWELLQNKTVYILPLVNPDGCEISRSGAQAAGAFASLVRKCSGGDYDGWTANARGVDLNHNFAAGWANLHQSERAAGIVGPSPRRYGGPYAESEPETAALCAFCRSRDLAAVYAFHTQGEVIYWQYGKAEPTGARALAHRLAVASGYALDEPVGLAQGGGFKDWFIEQFRRPGFTVECGKGVNPLDAAEGERIGRRMEPLIAVALGA